MKIKHLYQVKEFPYITDKGIQVLSEHDLFHPKMRQCWTASTICGFHVSMVSKNTIAQLVMQGLPVCYLLHVVMLFFAKMKMS